jgi:hypothetical protein
MNRFQKISFQSVDEFLDYIPEVELSIVEELRDLINDCIPNVKEKLSFNVPFYSRNKTICCIWPASIPWGNVPEDTVVLGLTKGHLLEDPYNVLKSGTRKYVRTIEFDISEEIDSEMVRFYLFEALELDK